MITIKIIPDLFSIEGREEYLADLPDGKKVYLSAFVDEKLYKEAGLTDKGLSPGDFIKSCDIWYEGRVIDPADYGATEIHSCSEIVFFARPGKGGILKTIVGAIMIIGGILLWSTWAGPLLVYGGIGMMTSGLAEVIWPQRIQTNFEPPNNKNYGWEGVRTDYAAVGSIVPVCYGRILTGGKCISQRIYAPDAAAGSQKLDLLLLVSEGEIRGIRKKDDSGVCTSTSDDPWIKLDNSFISDLPGVEWDYRLGTLDQSVIKGFQRLSTNYVENSKLIWDGTWHTINNAGSGGDFEEVEFNFFWPMGLFFSYSGDLGPWWTNIRIEYKEEPSGSWTLLWDGEFFELKTGPFYKTKKFSLPAKGQYSFRMKKYTWHSINPDLPGWGSLWMDECWIQSYNRILLEDLRYPGCALVAVMAIATDRISSSQPNIATKLDGRKLKYYDGSTWQNETWDTGAADEGNVGRNLAWQIHDLIYNEIYGLGPYFDESLKASAKFKEMADYANQSIDDGQGGTEPRFRSDIIVDGIVDPWDMIKELLRSCHAFPVLAGAQIWPVVEKERSPVMSFGMDNVTEDDRGNTTFIENWRALEDKPNVIEVQYYDAVKDFVRDTIQYPDDDTLIPTGEKIKKLTVIFHNITRRSQAARLAKFTWLQAQLLKKYIQFSTQEEAIGLQPGDVFYFSHDIPQYDYSGKIFRVRLEDNIIELDNSWDAVDTGQHTYKLLIRDLDNDTIETKDVTAITTENKRHLVTFSGSYSFNPAPGDPYILIEDTTVPIQYVCMELGRDEQMHRTISAQEYNADIFDYTVDIESIDYSDLPNPFDPPPAPTDLTLLEMPSRWGFWVNAVVPAGNANYDHCRIYLSTEQDIGWAEVGRISEVTNFPVTNVLPGITYYIKVVSYNRAGVPCVSPPTESITITGAQLPPKVRGLEIFGQGNDDNFVGKDCKIQWKLATNWLGLGSGDLGQEGAGLGESQPYYIKDTKVSVFVGNIEKRTEFIAAPGNTFIYSLEKNIEDNIDSQRTFEFRLWYRDNYNRLSPECASLQVTNSAPSMAGQTPTVSDIPYGVRVDWTNIVPNHHDVDKYHVYCDENNPPTTVRARASQYETLVSIVDLDPDTTYFIRVVPGDPYGMGTPSNTVQKSIPVPPIVVPVGPSDPTQVGELKLIENILEFDDCDDYTKWTSEIGGIALANDAEVLKEGSASLKVAIDEYTPVTENLWYSIPNPPFPDQIPGTFLVGDLYTKYVTQGFKVPSACNLKRVGIIVWKYDWGNPPGLKVMVYDDDGNGNPNTKLGECTFSGINDTQNWRWATFSSAISLSASTQYHLVLCRTDESYGDCYEFRFDGGGKYGDAQYDYMQWGQSLSSLIKKTDSDFIFRCFKDEATVNNHFKITSLGSKDISDYLGLEYWIKSNLTTANWLQASMGESALGEQIDYPGITETWSPINWDLSGISVENRDAIAYFGFKVINPDQDNVVDWGPGDGKIWLWIDNIRSTGDKALKGKCTDRIVVVWPSYSKINVRDCGVLGKGTEEESVKAQNALDLAPKGKVFFPDGIYLVKNLSVYSGQTFEGYGNSSLLRIPSGATGDPQIFKVDGKTDVVFRNLGFDGNNTGVPGGSHSKAIYILNLAKRIRILNCGFFNNTSDSSGVRVDAPDASHYPEDILIQGSNFDDIDCGILTFGCKDVRAIDNTFRNTKSEAISFWYSSGYGTLNYDVLALGNHIFDSLGHGMIFRACVTYHATTNKIVGVQLHGILLQGELYDGHLTDNTIKNYGALSDWAIGITTVGNPTIEDLFIEINKIGPYTYTGGLTQKKGINLGGTTVKHRIQLGHNILKQVGIGAISLEYVQKVMIQGNIAEGVNNSDFGIYADSNSDRVFTNHNEIYNFATPLDINATNSVTESNYTT